MIDHAAIAESILQREVKSLALALAAADSGAVKDTRESLKLRLIAELKKAADRGRQELLPELQRVTGHLETWAGDHANEATAETWAALHCARAAIARAEGRDPQ